MGLKAKVKLMGDNIVIVLVMPIEDYELMYRGASLIYKCRGEGVKNPLARYIIESLKYVRSIRSCREA